MTARGSRRAMLAFGFGGALAAGACGGGGGDATTATVRDSAGIAIVESAAPARADGAGIRLAAEPALVIGAGGDDDPAQQLFRVQAVHRLRDGRIVVADGGSAQIRFYGADGVLRQTAGGQGGGPGEFGALGWIGVGAADSIVAYDGRQRRFAVLDDTGAFVRLFTPAASAEAPVFPRPVGLLGDGTVLATASATLRGAPPTLNGAVRDTVAFVRIAPDGAVRELPARVPAAERIIRASPQAIEIVTPPFAHVLATAARGDRVYAASGDRYEIAQYDTVGRMVRLLRLPAVARAVTPDDVEAHIARATADVPDPAARQQRAAGLRALAMPERMPAVARLVVDDAGRLWAMDFLAPRDTAATWRLFDAEGGWIGSLAVPRAFTIHAVGAGHVLGVFRDEDDVEQVHLYALEEPR